MRYSTYRAVEDKASVLIDEPWETFAQRLLIHAEVTDKSGVGLFNCTQFGGSGRCLLSTAVETHALILDFDNAIQRGHPDYEEGVKKIVANPAQISDVEAVLSGWECVIVTSHSHTDAWPRFRVVVPLAAAVVSAYWRPFANTVIDKLGLSMWRDGIDVIYRNPTQQYYWPSCPPGGLRYASHLLGAKLTFVADEVSAAQAASGGNMYARKAGSKINPFKPDQVQKFWESEVPTLQQTSTGAQWHCPCPIHNTAASMATANSKFYVNPATGAWYCQSACVEPNKGGDMYRYIQVRYGMSFADAKDYVHSITGAPDVEHASDQISTAIEDSHLEEVPLLIDVIAKQPKAQQKKLVQQLVSTHQLDEDMVREQLTANNKITPFRKPGTEPQEEAGEVANEYGLKLSSERYRMDYRGIHAMRWVPQGAKGPVLEQVDPPLADRAIWPAAIGLDLATDTHFIELCWTGSQATPHSEWVPENFIRNRDSLLRMDDAPISLESLGRVSSFLTYAKTRIDGPLRTVTTEVGWFGQEGNMRFVLPCEESVQYIGPPMAVRGTVAGWAEGLKALLGYGESAYRSLVVLGLCAASPLVRLARKRNPVVGLLASSGSGKNKVIEYGLSMWDDFDKYRIPADSTVKGMQDRAIESPDFPIFVDELQQLPKKDPLLLESVFYWMGNGVRRVTSSKTQTAKGGERRYGVALFAAEHDIMRGLQQGAQGRVIALEGPPLPKNQDLTIQMIEHATNHHAGVVGRALGELFNEEYLMMLAEVEVTAMDLASLCVLKGDDPYAVALAAQGLQLLGRVTGLDVPHEDVLKWLLDELSLSRKQSLDTAEDIMTYVLEAVLGMPWGNQGTPDVLEDQDGGIAWRRGHATSPATCPLEINPTHPKIVELLRRKNIKEAIAAQWSKRGWVDANGPNLKRARSSAGHTPGARVWRFTSEALAKLGVNPDFSQQPEV